MTDLRKLIEAVEDGNWPDTLHGLTPDNWHLGYDAYHGDLNAAKALHEALLPGCGYNLEGHVKVYFSWVKREDEMLFPQHSTSYDNPARAWLIAILKAYEAQQ